jgi:hypothetical protein
MNIMHNSKDRDPSQVTTQPAAAPTTAKPGRSRRLLWVMLVLLLGSAVASFVIFRYVLPRFYGVPRELVGTWQVTEGPFKGATFECGWSGNAVFTVHKQGKMESTNSVVRVRGKRMFLTTKDPATGNEETLIQMILKLTDDELVFRDQDEVTYQLIRIGD